jgi:hypothetical protein
MTRDDMRDVFTGICLFPLGWAFVVLVACLW